MFGGWALCTTAVWPKFAFVDIARCIFASEYCTRSTRRGQLDRVPGIIMSWLQLPVVFILIVGLVAQAPDEGYSREQLLPLTKFRQQHRRTIDGRFPLFDSRVA